MRLTAAIIALLVATGASAEECHGSTPVSADCQTTNAFTTNTEIDQMIGMALIGKGKTAKFWDFELSDGANAMLHGYIPHAGDDVEFYVRQADCELPDVKCNFEIGIRKKDQP